MLTAQSLGRMVELLKQTNGRNNMKTLDLGNNEQLSNGVFPNSDGTFTALTFTKSKEFKTEAGAKRWHKKMTGG